METFTLEALFGALDNIVDLLVTVATPVAILMVLIAAFQMLFSGGDKEKFHRGTRTLILVVIGYALILLSGSIPAIIRSILH